jgi:TonB-dependent SusC/RagA subfamily outer membrane receptor
MDKRQVINPVYSLPDSEVGRVQFAHLEELLQGRVPGLRVIRLANGEFSVRLRGTRSFADDGEPLVVIDGVPAMSLGRALGRVAPGDVERVDVLNGAAAAIYGSRGANGVILITTKRGR